MESITKTRLSPGQLEAVVKQAFGPDAGLASAAELTDGWFNAAYTLALRDGRQAVLKVGPGDHAEVLGYERGIMRSELAALALVREAGGIPAPEVYASDTSRTLVGADWFVMEKIDGSPYNQAKASLSVQERFEIERTLGRFNRSINEIRGDRFGFLNESAGIRTDSWQAAFGDMIGGILADGRRLGAKLPVSYEELEAFIERRLPSLSQVTEPRLVHWDLWDGNLFVKDGRISAIIDWERALWGDPLMEFYFRKFNDPEAFLQGYGKRYDAPEELPRRELYDLYLDLILAIECYSRHSGEDQRSWTERNLAKSWARLNR
ncbi:Predicted kinase, aminoglycoside phosphotransferase (APT) family [Cohnella sp. OV330]|uniref:phosphotransferase family protein n=1 Tax=Cohnella sp. OV330 TaxID=1855288 RepID=UPI0008F28625|nr:aminoglycoside phosphotransferase family protein [Cohnella sp. OV330]SFB59209.1 Predicted kinase, aminoglycoside phosphotransferase (APT) family [Cohnella sp. OV330]